MTSDNTISQSVSQSVAQTRQSLWPNYSPPADLVFSHGQGSELVTEDGDVYLDFLSGIAVTSFGHAHPHLIKVLHAQAEKLWHVSNLFRIPGAERLASRLTDHCFGDRVFFANSGTEAVEAGIKAIRAYQAHQGRKQRFRIIGFHDSFHGRTLGALAAAGNNAKTRTFIPTDYGFDHAPWEDLDAVEALIGEHTAGVILEPVQGEGGIRPISAPFLEALSRLCKKHDLLLMVDEVQCGIGRTGKLFAHQHYGITPDIMALAKGLGGGFPIGACLTTAAVGDAMVVGTHGSTFGGNPLATAVGNGVLDLLLEPGLLDEVADKGASLTRRLEALIDATPGVVESVHGRGLMLGLKCQVENTALLTELRERKLLAVSAGGNMVRLLPPLNISSTDLERGAAIIGDAMAALT
ncbi:MAG: aspartate aminotransferase family protein [Pseudohongiellaceae bacterium]